MAGVGTGVASGAMTGAKVGSFLGPKGMAAGAVIGGAVGGLSANKKKKEAEASQNISARDTNEVSRLQRLDQIVKNLERGTDTLTQNKVSEVQKIGAQTQGVISNVSGGDVGATTQGLLQAQRNVQTGTNQALADRGQLPYFSGLASSLAQRVSQRALELQLLNRGQQTAEYAQGAKENNLSGNAAIATNFAGMLGGGQQGGEGLGGVAKLLTNEDGGMKSLSGGSGGMFSEYNMGKAGQMLGFGAGAGNTIGMGASNPAGQIGLPQVPNTLATGAIDLTNLGGAAGMIGG